MIYYKTWSARGVKILPRIRLQTKLLQTTPLSDPSYKLKEKKNYSTNGEWVQCDVMHSEHETRARLEKNGSKLNPVHDS